VKSKTYGEKIALSEILKLFNSYLSEFPHKKIKIFGNPKLGLLHPESQTV